MMEWIAKTLAWWFKRREQSDLLIDQGMKRQSEIHEQAMKHLDRLQGELDSSVKLTVLLAKEVAEAHIKTDFRIKEVETKCHARIEAVEKEEEKCQQTLRASLTRIALLEVAVAEHREKAGVR